MIVLDVLGYFNRKKQNSYAALIKLLVITKIETLKYEKCENKSLLAILLSRKTDKS